MEKGYKPLDAGKVKSELELGFMFLEKAKFNGYNSDIVQAVEPFMVQVAYLSGYTLGNDSLGLKDTQPASVSDEEALKVLQNGIDERRKLAAKMPLNEAREDILKVLSIHEDHLLDYRSFIRGEVSIAGQRAKYCDGK